MKEIFLSSPQISHMIRLFQKATDEIWVFACGQKMGVTQRGKLWKDVSSQS